MANYPIPNAPKRLNMNFFRSRMDTFGNLAKSCRYVVVIRPVGQYIVPLANFSEDLMYLTEIAEIPGRGFMNFDIRYYGPSHKLPFQVTYEDLTLTFLCRSESMERRFFDDWMMVINPINSFDFNYRDDYRADIDIYQYSEVGEYVFGGQFEDPLKLEPVPKYWITMHNAYPILVNPQPVTWADNQVQRLIVSFTYTHWSRKGLDREPGTYSLVEGRKVTREDQ